MRDPIILLRGKDQPCLNPDNPGCNDPIILALYDLEDGPTAG